MAHGDLGRVADSKLAARYCVEPLWDRLRIDVRKPMCGAFGCVYRQRGSSNVVKIVAGEGAQEELRASMFLFDLQQRGKYHDQLPRFIEIWDLGICATEHGNQMIAENGAFAFVREDLRDVPWDFNPDKRSSGDYDDPVYDATNSLIDIERLKWELAQASDEDSAAEIRDEMGRALDLFEAQVEELTTNDASYVKRMAPLFQWGWENGIVFLDAHLANWGLRSDGTLVIRDIGMAVSTDAGSVLEPESPVPIQTLSGLVRLVGHGKRGGRSWRRSR